MKGHWFRVMTQNGTVETLRGESVSCCFVLYLSLCFYIRAKKSMLPSVSLRFPSIVGGIPPFTRGLKFDENEGEGPFLRGATNKFSIFTRVDKKIALVENITIFEYLEGNETINGDTFD